MGYGLVTPLIDGSDPSARGEGRKFAMQRREHLLLLSLVMLAVLLLDVSAFSDEQKKNIIVGDGWRLELTDAWLTKEVGNVVGGGLRALPGKSILILSISIKYVKDAMAAGSIGDTIRKNAVILDAQTGKAITCPRFGRIRSSFSTEGGKGTEPESQYTLSPRTRAVTTKNGRVTRISYTACVEENKKKLLFVLPNFGTIALETLIHERESLWQGPLPDSPLSPKKSKD
jgi:hypothetical protein